MDNKNPNEIRELFHDFVTENQSSDRHSPSTWDKVNELVSILAALPKETAEKAYDIAMDIAVQFEEDGYVAGYIKCLNKENED